MDEKKLMELEQRILMLEGYTFSDPVLKLEDRLYHLEHKEEALTLIKEAQNYGFPFNVDYCKGKICYTNECREHLSLGLNQFEQVLFSFIGKRTLIEIRDR